MIDALAFVAAQVSRNIRESGCFRPLGGSLRDVPFNAVVTAPVRQELSSPKPRWKRERTCPSVATSDTKAAAFTEDAEGADAGSAGCTGPVPPVARSRAVLWLKQFPSLW